MNRILAVTVTTSLLVALLLALEITFGSGSLPPGTILHALERGPRASDLTARIVWSVRLPRAILAFVCGATLAGAGALLQAVTRNPLADPFLFGLSSGAAAGAVAVIVFVGDALGVWGTAIGAITGASLATTALFLLFGLRQTRRSASRRSIMQGERMVLCGLAISFAFSTLTNLLIFWGDRDTAQSILFWTMGSFAAVRWASLPIAVTALVALVIFGRRQRHALDALRAGEETACSLGIDTHRLKIATMAFCALATALTVALCGPIAFIGLVTPHISRRFSGSSLRHNFYQICVMGGICAMLGDLASRLLLPNQEIPVGIVISALGAIFLIVLMARRNGLPCNDSQKNKSP